MKPMFALIAVGVILFFVMFYFGKTSFEGVAETNIYASSKNYSNTAGDINKFDKAIKNLLISSDNKLTFKIEGEELGDYNIDSVEIANISSVGSIVLEKENDLSYNISQKLLPKAYLTIFHINSNGKKFKVQKTVIIE